MALRLKPVQVVFDHCGGNLRPIYIGKTVLEAKAYMDEHQAGWQYRLGLAERHALVDDATGLVMLVETHEFGPVGDGC